MKKYANKILISVTAIAFICAIGMIYTFFALLSSNS